MTSAAADSQYHAARLLLLLDQFTSPRRKLSSLTKLAKLDFLLRYPVMLERLMAADGVEWPEGTEPSQLERRTVESRMIRYKYGPWDDAYYPLVGSLVGRGLVVTGRDKRGALTINLTPHGRDVTERLAADSEWTTILKRCALLRKHYDLTGNRLKDRIYEELPDVVDRPHRTEI